MLEMINFVFPISASMARSSRRGSYRYSADDGCLEKVTGHEHGPYELWCNSGCRGSWILVAFRFMYHRHFVTLLFPITTPSSVSLLPIPFALSCRMLNVLSSFFICRWSRRW